MKTVEFWWYLFLVLNICSNIFAANQTGFFDSLESISTNNLNATNKTTSKPRPIRRPRGSCLVPDDLSDEIDIYHTSKPDRVFRKGSYVDQGDIIYKCKSKYKSTLESSSMNLCSNGKLIVLSFPKCTKPTIDCQPLPFLGTDTTITCEINGETVPCREPITSDTIVRSTCDFGYTKPSENFFLDPVWCDEKGEWGDLTFLKCERQTTPPGAEISVILLPPLLDENSPAKESVPKRPCLVPEDLPDKIQIYHASKPDQEIPSGSYVAEGEIIYKCKENYTLEGNSTNFCVNRKLTIHNHPKCTLYCKPLPLGMGTTATCEIDRKFVSCSGPLPPDVIVRTTCKPNYVKSSEDRYFMWCDEEGEWDLTFFCKRNRKALDESLGYEQPVQNPFLEELTMIPTRSEEPLVENPLVEEHSEGACLVPDNLSDEVRVYYLARQDQEIRKGTYVDSYRDVIYKCKSKYTLYGDTNNFCNNGEWSIRNHPKCIKLCSPLNGITIEATYNIGGETVSASQPLRPNTTAVINCAVGYRKTRDRIVEVLRCGEDGKWNKQPTRCEQICGVEAPEAVTFIIGGNYANITKVPWHVGIYSNIQDKRSFSHICGGTILNAKVIVSAAHCFWDGTKNQFHDASRFKVAAGKYYRDFYTTEPYQQILTVGQMKHEPKYNDYAGLYTFDIALLILIDYIKFQHHIKPICYEMLFYNDKNVPPGSIGRVAGWGLETSGGNSSKELKVIELPAIEYNECKKIFSSKFRPFITGDKFCAGFTDGESVCEGDSGGGLVFSKMIEEDEVYFLRGIVSIGSNKDGSCDNYKYSLFTNIQYHIDIIHFYESENRP